jgi:hypothetical protein
MHSRLGLNEGSLGDCAIRMDSCAYLVGMAGNNSVIRKSWYPCGIPPSTACVKAWTNRGTALGKSNVPQTNRCWTRQGFDLRDCIALLIVTSRG